MKDLIGFLSKKYIWFTLVILFCIWIGWVSVNDVKDWWQQILNKIGTIDVDLP